jgi:transposase, IS30 family
MVQYHRLTREERYQIEALLRSGLGIRPIARLLARDPSTISREVRCLKESYVAVAADEQSQWQRHKQRPKCRKIQGSLERYVRQRIVQDWSPEQVSGKLRLDQADGVSHQTIYRFIKRDRLQKGFLYKHLRILRKQRKDKVLRWKPTRLEGRSMIAQRPAIVEKRQRLGDYERDTMFGWAKGPILLTFIDRTSRYTKLAFLSHKCSRLVHRKTLQCLKDEPVKTITNDNGTEFSRHRETARALHAPIYFTHSYRAWERGTNENLNGLVRQYYPRKKPWPDTSDRQLKRVQDLLNNRPRKCLGFQTPAEVHAKLKASLLR